MAGLALSAGQQTFAGSVSIGVATRSERTVDIDSLIKLADEGVYQAKQAGRNGFIVIRKSA